MPKYLDSAGLSRFWNNIKGRIGSASQEQVDAWLDNHPEATTTVQNNTIDDDKLVQSGGVLSEVHDIRTGADGTTYDSAGDAVRGQIQNLIDNLYDSYYVTLPPEGFARLYFNENTGSYGGDNTRLCYAGGISLRGAKAVDIEITSGYVWNIYFYNDDASYSLVQKYSDVWLSETQRFITVPDGANRVQIQARKSDGTTFDTSELTGVFKVVLMGAAEKDVYEYSKDTDLHSGYYGHYQYVSGMPSVNDYTRLTQERLYKIGDYKLIRLTPKAGYNLVLNFFDENLVRLGNNGAWITSSYFIGLTDRYSNAAYFKISYRNTSNGRLTPTDYNAFTWQFPFVKVLAPIVNKYDLDVTDIYTVTSGDIAAYNGTYFFADTDKLYVDGTTEISAAVGHGNNVMFGKTLDGSFPKLYAGSWYQGEKSVYVSRVTASSATLVQTITYSSLPTGYLNMCVDEPNERVYIFMETGADTHQGNILFAVGDFSGNIITSKELGVSIPIIQGMDFVDGVCYLTSGNGTTQYPNYLWAFDASGNLMSKSMLGVWGEIEGISVDIDGTVYIKALTSLYKY